VGGKVLGIGAGIAHGNDVSAEPGARPMVMIRPLLIFFALVAVSGPTDAFPMPAQPLHVLWAAGVYVFFVWTATAILRIRTLRGLAGTRTDFVRTLRELSIGKSAIFWLACLLYGWMILGMNWPRVVREWIGLERVPLLDELFILAPLAAALVGSTAILRLAEEAAEWKLHRLRFPLTDWLPWNPSIRNHLRSEHGPWLIITFFLFLVNETVRWAGLSESASVALGMVMVGLFSLVGISWILRATLPLEPFPAGRLREALTRLARLRQVGLREVYLWNAPHEVANAAITGVFPRSRFVILSRALVNMVSPSELLSIFGHEVGHAKGGHLWILFASATLTVAGSFLAVTFFGWGRGGPVPADLLEIPLAVGLACPLLYLMIGWLSRQFEHQADLEGCRAASVGLDLLMREGSGPSSSVPLTPAGVQVFGSALERVAIFNGIDPDRWTWRGGRLRDRIRFLQRVEVNPSLGAHFDRRLTRQVTGLLLTLSIGVTGLMVARVVWPG
jgi:Zn-dependent protease with chaperone function